MSAPANYQKLKDRYSNQVSGERIVEESKNQPITVVDGQGLDQEMKSTASAKVGERISYRKKYTLANEEMNDKEVDGREEKKEL